MTNFKALAVVIILIWSSVSFAEKNKPVLEATSKLAKKTSKRNFAECPSKCSCSNSSVDCSNHQLSSVPRGFAVSTTSIDLSFNSIDEITSTSFSNLINLQRLDLSHNDISTIDYKAFIDLANLTWLSLSSNYLSTISNGDFVGLTNIRHLDFSYNDRLSSRGFPNISSLEKLELLDISGTGLTATKFPPSYGTLSNLRTLKMSFNQLSKIYNEYFTNIHRESIFRFECAVCSLTFIEAGFFSYWKKLTYVNLSGNALDFGQVNNHVKLNKLVHLVCLLSLYFQII